MKNLTVEQLEYILGQMKTLQSEHPKANVIYNIEQNGVQIIYPLPKDYYKIHGLNYE